MRLLLDTHVFLWWLDDDRRLGQSSRALLAANDATVFVSAASAWEIAIKVRTGKLRFPYSVLGYTLMNGFQPLEITFAHAERAGALPLHHADPFDRMLVAQAQAEDLVLVTADDKLAAYQVALLRA